MVIKGGVNIYPRTVEEVLHRHPAVVDCAVFGVPDERDGEHLHAVVETARPRADGRVAPLCRGQPGPWSCPSTVEVVDQLPRDPNGKVLKRHLRTQAWAASRPEHLSRAGPTVADGLFRVDDDGHAHAARRLVGLERTPPLPPGPGLSVHRRRRRHAVDLPSTGRLWGWTEVTAAPPGYDGPVPYGLGVVELDTGDDPGLRSVGTDRRMLPGRRSTSVTDGGGREVLDDGDDDAVVWAFAPDDGVRRVTAPVAIAGVGLYPFGRHGEMTADRHGRGRAGRSPWRRPDVGRGDFQAAFCATAYGGVAAGHRVLGAARR